MKISMISEHASPLAVLGGADAGGQNVHVAELALALGRRGDQVTVYTRRDSQELEERVPLGPGVEVVNVTAGPAAPVERDRMLPHMAALADGVAADWAQGGAPELVHSHFWMSGLAALDATAQLATRTGELVPVVHTFHALGTVKRRHQGAADTSPAERAELEPRVGQEADAIIATCTDEVDELAAMGVDRAKASVVPCGVDTARFTPRGPRALAPDRPTIAVVGRIVPRKGADLVISALAELADRGIADVDLIVVGGPDAAGGELLADAEIARLAEIACALGVGDRVRFLGRIPQEALPAVLRSVDAVVCTPWYEPFGIVPLEAMACGVPVVAAAVGGLRDTVVDGVTGVHVPPRDPAALADALAALLPDAARRRALGRAGRERVECEYTWAGVAERTARVYRRVLADVGRPLAELSRAR
jgi:type III pantothenate kinase